MFWDGFSNMRGTFRCAVHDYFACYENCGSRRVFQRLAVLTWQRICRESNWKIIEINVIGSTSICRKLFYVINVGSFWNGAINGRRSDITSDSISRKLLDHRVVHAFFKVHRSKTISWRRLTYSEGIFWIEGKIQLYNQDIIRNWQSLKVQVEITIIKICNMSIPLSGMWRCRCHTYVGIQSHMRFSFLSNWKP